MNDKARSELQTRCAEAVTRLYKPSIHSALLGRIDREIAAFQTRGLSPQALVELNELVKAFQGTGASMDSSSVGSLVLYCLGLSSIDPLKYGLGYHFECYYWDKEQYNLLLNIDEEHFQAVAEFCRKNLPDLSAPTFRITPVPSNPREVERLIRASGDPDFSWSQIPEDDPATWTMIQSGQCTDISDLVPVFLEGLTPRSIEDLCVIEATVTKGARLGCDLLDKFVLRQQYKESVPTDPICWCSILEKSQGEFVFREQVFEALEVMTGWDEVQVVSTVKLWRTGANEEANLLSFVKGASQTQQIPADKARTYYERLRTEYLTPQGGLLGKGWGLQTLLRGYRLAFIKTHWPSVYSQISVSLSGLSREGSPS